MQSRLQRCLCSNGRFYLYTNNLSKPLRVNLKHCKLWKFRPEYHGNTIERLFHKFYVHIWIIHVFSHLFPSPTESNTLYSFTHIFFQFRFFLWLIKFSFFNYDSMPQRYQLNIFIDQIITRSLYFLSVVNLDMYFVIIIAISFFQRGLSGRVTVVVHAPDRRGFHH